MLTGVVQSGTGTAAAISGVDVAGKTGTTTNYADAWFVGWTPQMTTAVWVGFPQGDIPMLTNYNGSPVDGGTYPALIWHDYMVQALQIYASEHPKAHPKNFANPNGSAFNNSSGVLGGGTPVGNSGNSGNTGNTGSGTGTTGTPAATRPPVTRVATRPPVTRVATRPPVTRAVGRRPATPAGGRPATPAEGRPATPAEGRPATPAEGRLATPAGGRLATRAAGQTGNSGSGGAGVAGVERLRTLSADFRVGA